jgi:hypothetical protein
MKFFRRGGLFWLIMDKVMLLVIVFLAIMGLLHIYHSSVYCDIGTPYTNHTDLMNYEQMTYFFSHDVGEVKLPPGVSAYKCRYIFSDPLKHDYYNVSVPKMWEVSGPINITTDTFNYG